LHWQQENQLESGVAGQNVGIRQEDDQIWLVFFMDYDIGYFDLEACRVDPVANPFGAKVLTMSPV